MYNDDAGLGGAIDDAVLASRCVGSWPAQLKALQEAEPRMLEQEELELTRKAKGLGFGVAALLFASAGRLLSLDLSDAGLGSTKIAAVAGRPERRSCASEARARKRMLAHFSRAQ